MADKTHWTPEEIAYLRTARAAGLSQGEIANTLKTRSRSSVGSAIKRLNIPFTPKPKTIEASSTPPKNIPPKPVSRAPYIAPHTFHAIPDKNPNARNLELVDLTPFQCHYPHGDGFPGTPFFFCGADTTSYPYCNFHRKVAYRPLQKSAASGYPR